MYGAINWEFDDEFYITVNDVIDNIPLGFLGIIGIIAGIGQTFTVFLKKKVNKDKIIFQINKESDQFIWD